MYIYIYIYIHTYYIIISTVGREASALRLVCYIMLYYIDGIICSSIVMMMMIIIIIIISDVNAISARAQVSAVALGARTRALTQPHNLFQDVLLGAG